MQNNTSKTEPSDREKRNIERKRQFDETVRIQAEYDKHLQKEKKKNQRHKETQTENIQINTQSLKMSQITQEIADKLNIDANLLKALNDELKKDVKKTGQSTSSGAASGNANTSIYVSNINPNIPIPNYNPKTQTAASYLNAIELYFESQGYADTRYVQTVAKVLIQILLSIFPRVLALGTLYFCHT